MMVRQRQHHAQKQFHHHDNMGFHKIESFFSDIFGCGKDCHKFAMRPGNANTTTASATTTSDSHGSNLRPIVSLEADLNQGLPSSNINLRYPRGEGINSKQLCMDGILRHTNDCNKDGAWFSKLTSAITSARSDGNHHHETNESFSSILDETATTHLDSFVLDESSSLSTNGSFSLPQAQPPNQEFVGNGQASNSHGQKKALILPMETEVGTWPPLPPVRGDHLRMTQQQQQIQSTQERYWQPELNQGQQRNGNGQQQSKTTSEEHEKGEPPIAVPIRPPKIRRLKLDDALSSSTTMGREAKENAAFPLAGTNDLLPTREEGSLHYFRCNYYNCYDDPTIGSHNSKNHASTNPSEFLNSNEMYRSRSLDFLCSSSRYTNRRSKRDHQGDEHDLWMQEHRQQKPRKEPDQNGLLLCPEDPRRLLSRHFWSGP